MRTICDGALISAIQHSEKDYCHRFISNHAAMKLLPCFARRTSMPLTCRLPVLTNLNGKRDVAVSAFDINRDREQNDIMADHAAIR